MKKLFKSTPKAPSPAASVALLDGPDSTPLPVYAQHAQAQLRQQPGQAQHQRIVPNPSPPVSGQLQANRSWQEREREKETGASSPVVPHAPAAGARPLGQQLSTASDSPFSATTIAAHPPAIAKRHSVLYGTPNDSWEVLDRQSASASVRERDRSASVPALTSGSSGSPTAVAGAGVALRLVLSQVQSDSPIPQSVQQWVYENRETSTVALDSQAVPASAHLPGSAFISSGGSAIPPFVHAQPQRTYVADRAVSPPSPPVTGQGGPTKYPYQNGYSPTSPSHPPQLPPNAVSETSNPLNSAPAMLRKKTPSNNSSSSGGQSSSGARAGQILGALDPSMFGMGSGMASPVSSTHTVSQTQSQIQREREREQLFQQQQQQHWVYQQQQQVEFSQAQQRPSSRTNVPQNSRGKSFLDSSIKSSSKPKASSKTKERGLGEKLRRNKSTRKNRDSLSDIEFKAKSEEDEEDMYHDDSEREFGSESLSGSVDQHHAQFQHAQMLGYPHPHSQPQVQHGFMPPNADHADHALVYDAELGSNHFASPTHHAVGSAGGPGGHGSYAPLRRPSAASSSFSHTLPPSTHSAQGGSTMPSNERRGSWASNPTLSPYPPSSGGSGAAIPPSARRDIPRESMDWDRETHARYQERDMDVDGSNVSTLKGVEIASGFATGILTESKEGKDGRSSRGFFDRLKEGVGVDWESSEHSHRDTGHNRPKDREKEVGDRTDRVEKRDRKEGKEEWWEKIFSKDKDKTNEKKTGKKDKGESTLDKLLHSHQQQQPPSSVEHGTNKISHQQNLPLKERERELRERDKETKTGLVNAGFIPTALNLDKSFDKNDLAPRMVGAFVSPTGANLDVNWGIALDLCERTSDPDVARGVAKAIRKELKYARVSEQLGATTLWAIMLQNASPLFITQTCSRKFLDVVEDLITQNRMPLVRERLLEVLGAAVYISGPGASEQDKSIKDKDWAKRENFRSLWKKVKPDWMPEEGTPLSTDNSMFHPHYTTIEAPAPDSRGRNLLIPDTRERDKDSRKRSGGRRGEEPATVIIPVDEDIRRLFQECKIGRGNASLLCEALAFATPEDLRRKDLIKEFHSKCMASLELISAQIPWATAGAERSRQREIERGTSLNPGSNMSASSTPNFTPSPSPSPQPSPNTELNSNAEHVSTTKEERLLAELLHANEELADALRIYSDIERIGKDVEAERTARERSKAEVRGNVSQLEIESLAEGSSSASTHQVSVPVTNTRSYPPAHGTSSQPSLLGDSQTSGQMRFENHDKSVGHVTTPQYISQHASELPHSGQQTAYSIPTSLQPGNALYANANANTIGVNLGNFGPQEQPVSNESSYHQQVHSRAMPIPPAIDPHPSMAPVPPHGHTYGHTHSISQNSVQLQLQPAQGHPPAPNAMNTGTLTGPRQLRGPRSPLPIPGQYNIANRDSVVGTPNTPNAPLSSAANHNQLLNGLQNVHIQSQPGQFGASRTPSPAPLQLSRPSSLVLPHPPSIQSRSHSRAGSLEVPQLEHSTNNSPNTATFTPTPALSFSHGKMYSAANGADVIMGETVPMSDKAAGKRRAVESWNNEEVPVHGSIPPSPVQHPPNLQHADAITADETSAPSIQVSLSSSSDSESDSENRWAIARRRWKTQYVYDAAAERARERVRQLQLEMQGAPRSRA